MIKNKKIIIVDVDGTVASRFKQDVEMRAPMDWSKVSNDIPLQNTIDIINILANTYYIIFISGRSDICRDDTQSWLQKYFPNCTTNNSNISSILMRAHSDHRKDELTKSDLIKGINTAQVQCVFDDRDSVVAMWRKLGLTCYQVNYGDF